MNFDTYQTKALETAIYPESGEPLGLAYTTLGLTNEAGEVAGLVKKFFRDTPDFLNPQPQEVSNFQSKMAKELGDVLWYLATTAAELNLSLDDIAAANLEKLAARANRGTLQGSGDER